MTFLVTDGCIGCKYGDCVEVCPVHCFKEGPKFLVIDPDECIDCGLCVPECPMEAIYSEDDLPDSMRHFIDINAMYAKKWQSISQKPQVLPEAEQWKEKKNKLEQLRSEDFEW